MRVAVLSDIHGNWFALLGVLEDAVRHDVQQVWCLGDVVGYGPHGLRCYRELKHLPQAKGISLGAWVAGNHDWALAGRISAQYPRFNPAAEWALHQSRALTVEKARDEFLGMCTFLGELPTFSSPQVGVWLMHGWVTNAGQESNVIGHHSYIWDRPEDAWKAERSWSELGRVASSGPRAPGLILAGHTHQPLLWYREGPRAWHPVFDEGEDPASPVSGWRGACPRCGRECPCCSRRQWDRTVVLPSEPVLINPGSVGQPRDGCPAAAYAILEFEGYRTRVTFRRVGYDVRAAQDALAGLARRPDGGVDASAMQEHVSVLRRVLAKGEW